MKNIRKLYLIFSLSFLLFAVTPPVIAATNLPPSDVDSSSKLAQLHLGRNFVNNNFRPAGAPDTPALLILNIIGGILKVLAAIATAAIVYGGFLYVTSTGNEEQARRAKMTLVYSAVGLIIIGLSVIIVNAFINAIQ